LNTDANSTPITPPPSTTTLRGTSSSRSASLLVMIAAADLEAGERAGVAAGGEHDLAPT
jgi:hypothetical protein